MQDIKSNTKTMQKMQKMQTTQLTQLTQAIQIKTQLKKLSHAFLAFAILLIFSLNSVTAHAKKFGGNRSFGKQNNTAVQKYQQNQSQPQQNSPNNTNNATQNTQSSQSSASNMNPAAAKTGMFGRVLTGLAIGAGLAWLASSLGIQQELMNMLLILGVIMLAFAAFRWFKNRKMQSQNLAYNQNTYATAAAAATANSAANNPNNPNNSNNSKDTKPVFASDAANYNYGAGSNGSNNINNPNNLNNLNNINPDLSSNQYSQHPQYAQSFMPKAQQFFENIQAYNQKNDQVALQKTLSAEMFAEYLADFDPEVHQAASLRTYLIHRLNCELLDASEDQNSYSISVRYTGMFYENEWQAPTSNINNVKNNSKNDLVPETPIDEIWQLEATKAHFGSDDLVWKLVGVTEMSFPPSRFEPGI